MERDDYERTVGDAPRIAGLFENILVRTILDRPLLAVSRATNATRKLPFYMKFAAPCPTA